MIHDVELEIVLVHDALREKNASRVLFDKIAPDITVTYEAYVCDRLQALVAGTKEVVSEIEIRPYKSLYKIFHEPEDPNKFRVGLHNELPDVELDIVLVYNAAEEKEVWEVLLDGVVFDETIYYHAYTGDVLWALIAKTDTAVSDIEIRLDQSLNAISQMESLDFEL